MELAIDRNSSKPIYRQIVEQIRDLIISGVLPEGFALPPERRLAEALRVNRSTVLNAYRELKADALVDAHVGRGTIVQRIARPAERFGHIGRLPWRQLFRDRLTSAQDPLIRDLLELSERRDMISLSIGLPAPELLPAKKIGEIFAELIEEVGPELLLHMPTEGHSPLRETLATWLATRGINCQASEVLVLSGSQQGLDLASRIFIDPGDTIIVEEPTYIGALLSFRNARARIIGVPTDEYGMRTDILATLLERVHPKLIYTLPTFQNPSGVVMSLERRRHLLELAHRFHVPILEDDPYSEMRYEGKALPSLKAIDDHGHVLYLSTFSKSLFPGMRLGYLVASATPIRQFALLKQGFDLHSNGPGQWILDRFIKEGLYDQHLGILRDAYRIKRDAMHAALEEHAPARLRWQKPQGGFYFWITLPQKMERQRLIGIAAETGVAFLPGWSCFADEPEETNMRLNFSFASESLISEGVARLMASLQKVTAIKPAYALAQTGTPPVV